VFPTPARRAWSAVLVATAIAGCRIRQGPPPPRDDVPAGPAAPDDRFRAEVRRLVEGDFVERARASERLVAAGEDALPALVEAGDAPVAVHGGRAVAVATRPVVEAILAAATTERLETVHLVSPGASVRRVAADELGRRGAWTAVPALVSRLGDPDAGVRAASAAALRRVTGRADVLAPASPADAPAVVARWRAWWEGEGRGLAPIPPASSDAP
jgi:HEAT repeat protein